MATIEAPAGRLPHPAVRSGTNAEIAFLLLILVMPFTACPLVTAHILDIPGFKFPNIVAAIALFAFLTHRSAWRIADPLQRSALIAFSLYVAILVIAFLRSLPNVARFHALFAEAFQAGRMEYWQSYLIAPFLFAGSFVYVVQCLCSRTGIQDTIAAISIATFVLSCAIIGVMFTHPGVILDLDPGRHAVNGLTNKYLGLHYNGAGTIYVITAPLLLYMALTRGSLWIGNLVAAFVAVLLLKSRTAILTFVGIDVFTLVVLGRTRMLAAFVPLVAISAAGALGNVIIHLLSTGITSSGISTYALFSGREQAIWLPLLQEWLSDPYRFWLGAGLFGLMTSDFLYSARSVFAAGEAHNLYLEFFLDNGIVLFLVAVAAVARLLVRGARFGRRVREPFFWVLFLCAISFLISGITGRRYFPEAENLFLFPLLGLMINVARLKLQAEAPRPAIPGP